MKKIHLLDMILYLFLIIMAGLSLFPLLWMFRSSFMTSEAIFAIPIQWFIKDPQPQNFAEAMTAIPFLRYFFNTLFIVGLNMVGNILASSFCAFGFSRIRFPGRDFVFSLVLSTLMIPGTVLMIPQFFGWKILGLYDTYWPLIAPSFFLNAFFIFMIKQFFSTIPMDYDEAAFIDGANYPMIYWKVILPMSKPVIATVGVFTFMWTWNDFFGPLIYLQNMYKYTLALGLMSFKAQYKSEWHYLMAVSTVITVPMIIIYFFAQRFFVQGLTFSGLKA
jgi:multiple sugar transport system permease protein